MDRQGERERERKERKKDNRQNKKDVYICLIELTDRHYYIDGLIIETETYI